MTTTASGDQAYTALLSGNTINGHVGQGAFITYSFPTAPPSYLIDLEGSAGADTFRAATPAYQDEFRAALAQWSNNANITFFEVAPDQGEIQLTTFDLQKWSNVPGAAAFTYSPANGTNDRLMPDIFSDVVVDWHYATPQDISIPEHEIGHALGLKHADDPIGTGIVIDPSMDNTAYTIMEKGAIAPYTQVIGSADIQAAQYLFGTPNQGAVMGDEANNTMTGGTSADYLKGNGGHDVINGGDGNDSLFGGDGNDHLYGASLTIAAGSTDGNDTILAGNGSDYIQGNAGRDFLAGEDGSDRINGGADSDVIYGGGGNDSINGNKGDDRAYGEAGNDFVRGGQGNDYLNGGDGNDLLAGDLGSDTLVGGAGTDVFTFSDQGSLTGSPDVVSDFTHGQDHISLGYAPSAVLTGSSQADASAALTAAQQLLGGHLGDHDVAAFQVGADTYVFYAGNGGNTVDSAIDLAGFTSSTLSVADFI